MAAKGTMKVADLRLDSVLGDQLVNVHGLRLADAGRDGQAFDIGDGECNTYRLQRSMACDSIPSCHQLNVVSQY